MNLSNKKRQFYFKFKKKIDYISHDKTINTIRSYGIVIYHSQSLVTDDDKSNDRNITTGSNSYKNSYGLKVRKRQKSKANQFYKKKLIISIYQYRINDFAINKNVFLYIIFIFYSVCLLFTCIKSFNDSGKITIPILRVQNGNILHG